MSDTKPKRTYQSVIYVSPDMLTLQPASPPKSKQKQQSKRGKNHQKAEFSPDLIYRLIDRIKEK